MNLLAHFTYRILNKLAYEFHRGCSFIYLGVTLRSFPIECGNDMKINGFPRFIIHRSGKLLIGNHFRMNSGRLHNPIGRNQRCVLSVGENACLTIGDHVGMSSVAIVCQQSITIGNHVKIGGNTVIYDTDFHSLDAKKRAAIPEETSAIGRKPVIIGDHVFIGGHSILLKGTTIGQSAIIGAGSVVSGIVPPFELWGGNPARFIRKLPE